MLVTFTNTLLQMLKLAIMLGVGFAFRKLKAVPESFNVVISKLATTLFLPALQLNTFMTNCTVENFSRNAPLLLYGVLLVALLIAAGYTLAKPFTGQGGYQMHVMRYAVAFPNTGAFLIPLTMVLMTSEELFFQMLFLMCMTFMCYSWGIVQLLPSNDGTSILKKLVNPNTVMIAVGAILGLTGLGKRLPQVVCDAVEAFGAGYTPMSLMLVGYVIAGFKLEDMLPTARTWLFIFVRMIVLPMALLFFMKLIGAPYYACYFTCAAVACPAGMNAVVYPVAYGQDCRFGAALVLCSTAVSVVTIPLMYALMSMVLG